MSARDYLRLLADCPTIVRTLRETYGSHEQGALWRRRAEVRRVVHAVHPNLVCTRVAEIIHEAPDTRTLCLEAVDGDLPPHTAGQYVNVFVDISGVRTSRPMSISSPPGAARMRLTVKRKPGGFVSSFLVDTLQQGDSLTISGPEGDASYLSFRDGEDLMVIAGGSGITAFIGMIEQVMEQRPGVSICLLYGAVEPEQIIFRDRIEALTAQYERLTVTLTVDRPTDEWSGGRGGMDRAKIEEALGPGGAGGKTFFICGPPAMERVVGRALAEMGVLRSRVRGELTGASHDPTSLPGWPEGVNLGDELNLTVANNQASLVVGAGEPLLNSLERAGFAVPALCRSGTCGSCRTRLVQGTVVHGQAGQRQTDTKAGYVNACVCYPVSDVVVQIPGESFQIPGEPQQALAAPLNLEPPGPPAPRGSPGNLGAWIGSVLALGGFGLLVLLVVASIRWWS